MDEYATYDDFLNDLTQPLDELVIYWYHLKTPPEGWLEESFGPFPQGNRHDLKLQLYHQQISSENN